VTDQQSFVDVDETRMRNVVTSILHDAGAASGSVSLAVVDDDAIARLHGQYLGHDEPTDVMSFLLERDGDRIEAEVILSGQTAAEAARRYEWPAEHELLLYAVHGTLHLVGYDDRTSEQRAEMRRREDHYLAHAGMEGRSRQSDAAPVESPKKEGRCRES